MFTKPHPGVIAQTLTSLANRVASTVHLASANSAEGSRNPMNATDLITEQHHQVDALFKKFEKTDGSSQKHAIFDQIASMLVAHDAIERDIFYPACEKALGKDDDALDESLVEHGVVEFSIFRADACADPTYFDSYVNVLKEVVQHHVQEEQRNLLPKAKHAMKSAELETLGMQMKARFDEAMKGNWRAAVREKLDEVLTGSTKTKPKSSTKTAAKPEPQRTAASKSNGKASRKKTTGHSAHARSRKGAAAKSANPARKATRG